jgi:uncharacterized membrane protein YeaQ/YmgE (transglycosylase-associated protein family)
MGLILTIVMGLLVGMAAGFLMKSNYPWYIDILLGIAGAMVGGWITSLFLGVNLTGGFNLTSFIVALLGALLIIFGYRMISGRSRAR